MLKNLVDCSQLPITQERKLIMTTPVKSFQLDPTPSCLVNNCLIQVIPLLVDIVNLFFEYGQMPESPKQTLIIVLYCIIFIILT